MLVPSLLSSSLLRSLSSLYPARSLGGEELWNLNWASKQALVDGPIFDAWGFRGRVGVCVLVVVALAVCSVGAVHLRLEVQTNAAFKDAEGCARFHVGMSQNICSVGWPETRFERRGLRLIRPPLSVLEGSRGRWCEILLVRSCRPTRHIVHQDDLQTLLFGTRLSCHCRKMLPVLQCAKSLHTASGSHCYLDIWFAPWLLRELVMSQQGD